MTACPGFSKRGKSRFTKFCKLTKRVQPWRSAIPRARANCYACIALASVNVKLSADEITSLEQPYVPHTVVGFV